MAEQQGDYIVNENEQPAAIIDTRRTVTALRGGGLVEQNVWGWVKMSAKFISHIRHLKGAKLAVWNVVALTISESGKCELSVAEIAELAGYSTSETRATIAELWEMGYMTVASKSGKRNIYSPEFVARAASNPTDRPLQETCTPLVGTSKCADDPTSPSIGNSAPSIKRVKRVNIYPDFSQMSVMEAQGQATLQLYRKATDFFPGSLVWEMVHNTITENSLTYEKIHAAAVAWEAQGFKRENVKGILEWAINGVPDLSAKRNGQSTTERKSPNANKQRTPAKEPTDADRALAAEIKAERAAMQQL